MSASPFSFREEALTVRTKKWDTIMIPGVGCLPKPRALRLRSAAPTSHSSSLPAVQCGQVLGDRGFQSIDCAGTVTARIVLEPRPRHRGAPNKQFPLRMRLATKRLRRLACLRPTLVKSLYLGGQKCGGTWGGDNSAVTKTARACSGCRRPRHRKSKGGTLSSPAPGL
jgi:hypothetical protein